MGSSGQGEMLERVSAIVTGFVTLPEGETLGADAALLDGGLGLDSVTLLEILLAIEERLGCTIEPEELTPEVLATLGSLSSLVAHKAAAGDA